MNIDLGTLLAWLIVFWSVFGLIGFAVWSVFNVHHVNELDASPDGLPNDMKIKLALLLFLSGPICWLSYIVIALRRRFSDGDDDDDDDNDDGDLEKTNILQAPKDSELIVSTAT